MQDNNLNSEELIKLARSKFKSIDSRWQSFNLTIKSDILNKKLSPFKIYRKNVDPIFYIRALNIDGIELLENIPTNNSIESLVRKQIVDIFEMIHEGINNLIQTLKYKNSSNIIRQVYYEDIMIRINELKSLNNRGLQFLTIIVINEK